MQVLECPRCGGALNVDGSSTLIRCVYCGVQLQLGGDTAVPLLKMVEARLSQIEGQASDASSQIVKLRDEHGQATRDRDEQIKSLREKLERQGATAGEILRSVTALINERNAVGQAENLRLEYGRKAYLAMRRRYVFWRVASVLLLFGVTGALFMYGNRLTEPPLFDDKVTKGRLIMLVSPFTGLFSAWAAWKIGTFFGRRFNKHAHEFGFARVAVASHTEIRQSQELAALKAKTAAEQAQSEAELRKTRGADAGGCATLIVLFLVFSALVSQCQTGGVKAQSARKGAVSSNSSVVGALTK